MQNPYRWTPQKEKGPNPIKVWPFFLKLSLKHLHQLNSAANCVVVICAI
jgi:hypothetical protein